MARRRGLLSFRLLGAKAKEPELSKIVKQKPRGLVALHRREVVRRVNLSYVQIWKLIRAGKFPRGRKHTGTNRTIWFEHEIDAYLLQCRPQVLKGDERR